MNESPSELTSSEEEEDEEEDEEELVSLLSSGTPGSSDNEQVFEKGSKMSATSGLPVAKKSGAKTLSSMTPPKPHIVSGWKRHGQAKTSTSSDIALNTSRGGGGEGEAKEEEKEEVLPEGWNGQEIITFRMLRPIYCHNYCSIAEVIRTKTCQEVYNFIRFADFRFQRKKLNKNEVPLISLKFCT